MAGTVRHYIRFVFVLSVSTGVEVYIKFLFTLTRYKIYIHTVVVQTGEARLPTIK